MITEGIVRFLYLLGCSKVKKGKVIDNGVAFTLITEDDREFKKIVFCKEKDYFNTIKRFVDEIGVNEDLHNFSGKKVKIYYKKSKKANILKDIIIL